MPWFACPTAGAGHPRLTDQVVCNGDRKRNAKMHSQGPHLNFEVAADDSQLFYFDAVAVPVPDFINPEYARQPSDAPSEDCSLDEHKLLLPSHVSLLAPSTDGADPIEVIPPPIINSDDDYIDFLEYEGRSIRTKAPGLVRYFEVKADRVTQARPSIFKCKNCGTEGKHKTFEYPVLICLTCGARDKHST
ncbi:hypothetical protein EDD15DRAFT_2194951 [Pisolithus albus]|nr:hypothetical protein EDD15DRAFT_2194951 [Pisolithus albus]